MISDLISPRWGSAFGQLASFNRELDSMWDRLQRAAVRKSPSGEECWQSPVSLWEAEDGFHLEVELPGVEQKDVEVTFENGLLRISAHREAPQGERNYLHQERVYGQFQRTFSLSNLIDPESIQAQLSEGVLHLKFAKRPEKQPKKIDVKVG